jgi:hypothetical protein
MIQMSFDFNYEHNPEVLAQRTEQNRLKLIYLAAIKEFNKTEHWDSDLERKVMRAKDNLQRFERSMFGSENCVASVDYDSSNREHQTI